MISVCMATYNGEKYIKEQLDSILPQLKEADELILSDDGSSDHTKLIIEAYAKKDKRIQVIEGPRRGVIANFECALARSEGDIIFLADQDDVWLPNKVETMITYFEQHPEIQLVISDLIVVDDSLETIYESYFQYRNVSVGFIHNIVRNKYIGAGMAFRKSMLERALPFPKSLPMHDMWIGLLAAYRKQSALIPVKLTFYRRHGDNASEVQTNTGIIQQLCWRISLVKELIKRLLFSK